MTHQTDFGHESLSYDEKNRRVNQIFSTVAPHYDIMNDLLSGGLHRCWKKTFVNQIKINAGDTLLDLACGSGDIFLALTKQYDLHKIYAVDPNPAMLNVAKIKFAKSNNDKKLENLIDFVEAFGEDLAHFPDNSIDVVTLSFGLRNVANRKKCLEEIYRVLKPDGRFYLMEFSRVQGPLAHLYNLYRNFFVPKIGEFFFQDRSSYQYLADSISVFWDQDVCQSILREVGFKNVSAQNLMQGIVCIYSGQVDHSKNY